MSADLSKLPADLQAIIQAAIADALQAERAGNQAPQRTPREQLDYEIAAATAAEVGEKALPSSSGATHAHIIEAIKLLAELALPVAANAAVAESEQAI